MTRALQTFVWMVRAALGLVLIYSGAIKVARPYEFLNSVFQYELLGPRSATFVAAVLPFVELSVGAALLCGVFTLGAASIAATLLFTFTVGQASALLRGIDADCGCFGGGEKVGWLSMLRTVSLLASAILCVVSELRAVPEATPHPSNRATIAPVPLSA